MFLIADKIVQSKHTVAAKSLTKVCVKKRVYFKLKILSAWHINIENPTSQIIPLNGM